MKEGWERHAEVITFTQKELQEIVESYDPSLHLTSHELLSGGLSYTNYKVMLSPDDHPLLVRISKERHNLWKEYNIHNLLGVRETIPEFYNIGQYKGLHFGVLEWKNGVLLKDQLSLYNSTESYDAGCTLGRELGSLRKVQFDASGFLDSDLHVTESFELTPAAFLDTMEYFLFSSKVSRWLSDRLPVELMSFCARNAALFLEDCSGSRLVHGDFNGLNILMNHTDVSAILDWEFGIAGSLFMDIGNLLRYRDFPYFDQFELGLQSGLSASGERLPEKWKLIARITDLVALCSMLDNDFGGINRVRDINMLIQGTLNCDGFP
ncbi:MAG: phosphotransferase family protein [Bacilli bacterium]